MTDLFYSCSKISKLKLMIGTSCSIESSCPKPFKIASETNPRKAEMYYLMAKVSKRVNLLKCPRHTKN